MTDRAFVALIMGLSAGVLMFRLDHPALWGDEEISLLFAQEGWRDLMITHWTTDTHRPIYYALLKGWSMIWGDSRIALRSLNVGISLLCLPILFSLVRDLVDAWAARIALLVTPLSPMFVHYGRELRMYPLMLLAALMVFWALVQVIRTRGRGIGPWAALILAGVAAFYVHSAALLILPLAGLAVLVLVAMGRLPLRIAVQGAGALVVYGALVVPGLWPMWFHVDNTLADFWIPDPSLGYVYSQFAGLYPYPIWLKPLVGVAGLWGIWCLRARPVALAVLLTAAAGFPALMWGISFEKPVLIVRVMAWSAIFGGAIIAIGLSGLPRHMCYLAVAVLLAGQWAAIRPDYPAQRKTSDLEMLGPVWDRFDPTEDRLVLGLQSLEAGLRPAHPQLFQGRVQAINYRDQPAPFGEIYRAKFMRRDAAQPVEMHEGRLWIFAENIPLHPIPPSEDVWPALGAMVTELRLIETHTAGRLILQVYAAR
jgi:hypothetical protein